MRDGGVDVLVGGGVWWSWKGSTGRVQSRVPEWESTGPTKWSQPFVRGAHKAECEGVLAWWVASRPMARKHEQGPAKQAWLF